MDDENQFTDTDGTTYVSALPVDPVDTCGGCAFGGIFSMECVRVALVTLCSDLARNDGRSVIWIKKGN